MNKVVRIERAFMFSYISYPGISSSDEFTKLLSVVCRQGKIAVLMETFVLAPWH